MFLDYVTLTIVLTKYVLTYLLLVYMVYEFYTFFHCCLLTNTCEISYIFLMISTCPNWNKPAWPTIVIIKCFMYRCRCDGFYTGVSLCAPTSNAHSRWWLWLTLRFLHSMTIAMLIERLPWSSDERSDSIALCHPVGPRDYCSDLYWWLCVFWGSLTVLVREMACCL